MQPQVERRTSRRSPLSVPVLAKHPTRGQVWAQTRNISARGICFHASGGFTVGAVLEFILTKPVEVTLAEPVRIACTGRVVRIEKKEDGTTTAVAAMINGYKFLLSGEDRWTTREASN